MPDSGLSFDREDESCVTGVKCHADCGSPAAVILNLKKLEDCGVLRASPRQESAGCIPNLTTIEEFSPDTGSTWCNKYCAVRSAACVWHVWHSAGWLLRICPHTCPLFTSISPLLHVSICSAWVGYVLTPSRSRQSFDYQC